MSRVSSTQPMGPPPRPEGPWRRRWRRWWPAIGAALGLAATLWATLVGQTIPELLRDEDAPLRTFRSRVNAICVRSEPPRAGPQMIGQLEEVWEDRQTLFAELNPPDQYGDEYAGLLTAAQDVSEGLDRSLDPPARDDQRALDRVFGGLRAAADMSRLMQLRACRARLTLERVLVGLHSLRPSRRDSS